MEYVIACPSGSTVGLMSRGSYGSCEGLTGSLSKLANIGSERLQSTCQSLSQETNAVTLQLNGGVGE